MIGKRPITFPSWEKQGARLLGDVYDSNGFCTFQEIRSNFNLPGASFFFYLQLRASLMAYGVPWGQALPVHPLYELITTKKDLYLATYGLNLNSQLGQKDIFLD